MTGTGEKDLRLIYGIRALESMLAHAPDRLKEVWYLNPLKGPRGELVQLAEARGVITVQKKKSAMESLSADGLHQGIIGLVEPNEYVDWDGILRVPNPLIVAFDQVTDPRNLGAALRSVDALGGTGALLTKNRCARLGPTVCKTSAGASELIDCALETNLVRALKIARESDVQIVGLAFGGVPISEVDFTQPSVVVVGSEGRGIRPSTREACDQIVTIPMVGKTPSLNASVAVSVIMYEAMRQRSQFLATEN